MRYGKNQGLVSRRHPAAYHIAAGAAWLALALPTAALAWQIAINGLGNGMDYAADMAIDGAGNVVATGSTNDHTSGPLLQFNGTFPVVKLDGSTGATLWRHDITGTSTAFGDEGRGLTLDANGDVLVTGYTTNEPYGFDFTVAKLANATGDVIWQSNVNGTANDTFTYDTARDVIVDTDGDVLAAGGLMETGVNIASDFGVVKLAGANGAELWRASIDGTEPNGEDYANAVAADAAGNAIATGSLTNVPFQDVFVIAKFAAADGALLWRRDFQHIYRNYGEAVAVDAAGDAVAIGSVGAQGFAVKVRGSDGAVVWQVALAGTASPASTAYGLGLDAAGDVYVAGSAYNLYSGNDVVVWKLAGSDGHEVWRHAATTAGNPNASDYASALALDGQGNMAVGATLDRNFVLMRMRTSDGIELMRTFVAPWTEGYGSPHAVAFAPPASLVAAGTFEDESTDTEEDFFVTKLPAAGPIVGCGNGFLDPNEICDDGNDIETDGCLSACVSNSCVDGVAITDMRVKVRKGRAVLKGVLAFGAAGVPGGFSPSTRGAQLLLENGNAQDPILVDLTAATHPVPATGAGSCGAGDGWRVSGRTETYLNASGALDPPTCTPGSASGLTYLRFDDKTSTGKGLRFRARIGGLSQPPGEVLRVTVVLGGTAAEASDGTCGIVAFTPTQCVNTGTSFQCR